MPTAGVYGRPHAGQRIRRRLYAMRLPRYLDCLSKSLSLWPDHPAFRTDHMSTSYLRIWFHFATQGLFFLGVLLLVCSPLLTVVILGIARSNNELASRGTSVKASVIGKSQQTKVGAAGGTTYVVEYRFRTVDGNEQTGRGYLPFLEWEPLQEGSSLAVRYLPDNPSENQPQTQLDHQASPAMWVGVAIGSTLFVIGCIITIANWLGIRGKMRLLLMGDECPAEICEVHPELGVISYRYLDGDGREHVHKIQAPRGIQSARQVGDRFLVCVDPSLPERHVVDMLGARRVDPS